jgi:hypothetical protein
VARKEMMMMTLARMVARVVARMAARMAAIEEEMMMAPTNIQQHLLVTMMTMGKSK